MNRLVLVGLVVACADPPRDGDVVGPFRGEVRRYVVDDITLPTQNDEDLAADLDGDGFAENQFRSVVSALANHGNVTTQAAQMIASGALASTVEIQSRARVDDDHVGVWYFGVDGDEAVPVGGRLAAGAFTSNRTRETRVAGKAKLRLPLFVDTDPSEIELTAMQLDLTPDGQDGFHGLICGGFREADALAAAATGVIAMLRAQPQDHHVFWRIVDANRDGTVTSEEVTTNALVRSVLAADVELPVDGALTEVLSICLPFHLSPCAAGRCIPVPPSAPCFDRVRDGSETDVDCGGSCLRCAGGGTCDVGEDCQSGACDGGRCQEASCADGRSNNFESDVDCGGSCGATCPIGAVCYDSRDCASNSCTGSFGTAGRCREPT